MFLTVSELLASWTEEDIAYGLAWLEISALSFACFLLLFFIDGAPYGRYVVNASKLYGPQINANLSWFMQETPAFLIPTAYVALGEKSVKERFATSLPSAVLLGAFSFHYFQR